MTQKIESVKRSFVALFGIAIVAAVWMSCAHNKVVLPQYDEFAKSRGESVPHHLQEIYGKYNATFNERKFSSTYSLLLDPGKAAYMEVTDPAKSLLFAVSVEPETVTMFWAKDKRYVSEKATAENINAILGLPIMPDDLLLAIGGYGLDFPQWQLKAPRSDGWTLTRGQFTSELLMKNEVSRINLISSFSPTLAILYKDYRMQNNKPVPSRIRFEIVVRGLTFELQTDKFVPRDEPYSKDLFAVKIPSDAHRIVLKDVYVGKPLIMQELTAEQDRIKAAEVKAKEEKEAAKKGHTTQSQPAQSQPTQSQPTQTQP
jgi:hypothetical protein